jgi:hypothetical protein
MPLALTRADVSADKLETGTYDSQITGCHVEVSAFEGLLKKKMPALFKHLDSRDVSLLAVIPQWFLSLFSQSFPMEVRHMPITECFLAARHLAALATYRVPSW